MNAIARAARGRGGGKGGAAAGRIPREAENTLRSKATGVILDVLSEGPIEGLVDGLKSVFFNDTPLQNQDGTYNFQGINLALMAGLPDQAPLNGFDDLGAAPVTTPVATEVTAANGPVTRHIVASAATACRVSIRIPALFQQDKSNGDLNPYYASIQIELQTDNGGYETVVSESISGKCTAPYVKDYRIALPKATSGWDIRVRRLSPDHKDDASIQDETWWDSYTTIVEWPLSYPDTAYAAVTIDAELFGNQIPTRAYEIKGLRIQVPSNYDPATRTYSGLWNGTFKVAWTDNPAWVFYDLLTNPRYGLGSVIQSAWIDKWALYQIAQYCDELVPDGTGGMEPRFTFNGVLNTLQDAYTVLQSIAACFRGMVYYGAGLVTATQDAPAGTPVKLVTNANVIDGIFVYEGSSLRTRHTVAHVTFSDKDQGFKPTIEVVEDDEGLARWGARVIDIQGIGIASRSQARRIGQWILDSEKTQTETVTYKAGLDHADLRPGDVIAIQDRWYTGLRMGGRVAAASSTSITIDAPVTVVAGYQHILRVTLPDGAVAERELTNAPGETTVLTFAVPLTTLPQVESVWQISVPDADAASGTVAARPFRVLAVSEVEKATYQVVALFHDETKYDRVERGINRKPPVFSQVIAGPLPPPSGLQIQEYLTGVGVTSLVRVTFSWVAPRDRRVRAYQVQALSGGVVVRNLTVEEVSHTFEDLTPGNYTFQVRSLGGDHLEMASA